VITVIVSGAEPQRVRIAAKIAELCLTMGIPTLHYPKVDLRPATFPEGLEVAVFETSSTPEAHRA
jgi:hypothetical protein